MADGMHPSAEAAGARTFGGSATSAIRYHASILEAVGRTPLVQLCKVTRGLRPLVLAKVESFNPGGSVKDRIGAHMVQRAEEAGLLRSGGTIVEATSGNTGAGLAVAAAVRGYRCVCTMPDKMSQEKINLLKAYGARVVVCPTAVAPDSPESYYEVARRIARDTPGAWLANQYFNPDNPETHYRTTGPEIWEDTGGRITHFVAGLGTGGTISGVGRFLKERNPAVRIIGADPVGSILAEYFRTRTMGTPHSYLVEGIGEDIIPGTTHFEYIDEMQQVTDQESFRLARRLSREEGILSGGSCGTAVAVALRVAANLSASDLVVVLLPDSGERYLSKLHSDTWMRDKGLLTPEEVRVGDLLRQKSPSIPPLVTIPGDEPVRAAVELIRRHDISQIPVTDGRGGFTGTVHEATLMGRLFDGAVRPDDPVTRVQDAPLPRIQADAPVAEALRILAAGGPALLVEEKGTVVGLVSRFDVLGFVAS